MVQGRQHARIVTRDAGVIRDNHWSEAWQPLEWGGDGHWSDTWKLLEWRFIDVTATGVRRDLQGHRRTLHSLVACFFEFTLSILQNSKAAATTWQLTSSWIKLLTDRKSAFTSFGILCCRSKFWSCFSVLFSQNGSLYIVFIIIWNLWWGKIITQLKPCCKSFKCTYSIIIV